MTQPVSRAEFDALCDLAKLLSQTQDAAADRAAAFQHQLDSARAAQDILAKELARQDAALRTLRAAVIAVLQQGSPHLPPGLQGAAAAALTALETAR